MLDDLFYAVFLGEEIEDFVPRPAVAILKTEIVIEGEKT